jgi:MFS family permease
MIVEPSTASQHISVSGTQTIGGEPRRFDRLCLFLAVNYFAQGMSGLIYEPVSYLMKDGLKLSAGQSSSFLAAMTLPFLAQPLWGLLSDSFPIAGLRRKPHLLIFSVVVWAALIVLAFSKTYSYRPLLLALFLVSVGLCAVDVVCGAVAVERGVQKDKTGLYQAVKMATMYATLVVTGVGSGWLVAHFPYKSIFLLASCFPLLMAFSVIWVDEPKFSKVSPKLKFNVRWLEILRAVGNRRFLILAFFLFLWSFYPFLGTAQFYYQSEALKFGPVFIGTLSTMGGVAGFLGAAVYGRFCGGAAGTKRWVAASVWLGGLASLLYLLYLGPWSVAIVTVLTGFCGVAFRLALIDLAAQNCPPGFEAVIFACYMVVFDFAAWTSNAVGGKLYDLFLTRLSFLNNPAYGAAAALALIGTACTFSCAGLLPFLFPVAPMSIEK